MSRFATPLRSSAMRRAMLNFYGPLSRDPSLGGLCDIDARALLAFLERINESSPVKVTVTYVLLKTIGDAFRKYPDLNVKIVGKKLYELRHIDIRVAINLFPEEDESPEAFMALVKDVDRKGLIEIARELSGTAKTARRVGAKKNLAGAALRLTRYVPDIVYNLSMQAARATIMSGRLAALGIVRDPMGSTALTNVGSFGLPEGVSNVMITGLMPPFGYASVFLALPIKEKPVVVDGELIVRPVLPFGGGADHRAIDGYKIFRYFYYFADVLACPDDHIRL